MISHLGAMISVVNGALLARRFKGITGTVGAACIGDGATSTGAFHEALNQAAVEKLPLVLVVADNQYAYSTPTERQFACRSLVDKAAGYGIEGQSVDGTDLAACLKVVGEAVSRARAGRGPQMVVAELLRLCGHGEHDDASYMDPKLEAVPAGPRLPEGGRGAICCTTTGPMRRPLRPGAARPCRRRGSRRQGPARTRARSVQGRLVRAGLEAFERRARSALNRHEHHLP